MKIKDISVYQVDIALKEEFTIAFKTYTHAYNFLVVLETSEGIRGYGEGCPDKPITGDSREEAIKFLELAKKALLEEPIEIEHLHSVIKDFSNKIGFKSQTAEAAIDMAIYDILGKSEGIPVYWLFDVRNLFKVPNTLTIGIKSIEETVKTAIRYSEEYRKFGLKRIKLKLSGSPEEDYERVIRVADNFSGELTLDANQGYRDPRIAIKTFNQLYESLGGKIVLIEQPTPREDLKSLKMISEEVEIPIFADESAITLEDVQRIASTRSADGVNIKLQKIGGIFNAIRAAKIASSAGLKVMVGCNEETHIAISAAIHAVAGMHDVVSTDLDSDILLFDINIVREDPLENFVNGVRVPRNKPGLGIELTPWFKHILNNAISINRVV
ncbi:MAG: dipeptide epimerase [Nitrososphaerota archaeon]|nr:dipeptide epimerase [Nitrososphaerota archaeon]